MISWMQKNNKFLIWTIWIATIAFIASGPIFTGAGYGGAKVGSVAQVGTVEIKQVKLNMAYSNIYNRYNQAMNGTLDKKKADELGLIKQAFSRLETEARVLSFSKELGIIVSDSEVADRLQNIKGFQKDEQFDKTIYKNYLKSQRIKANVFEDTLRDEIAIQKTFNLLNVDVSSFELETISTVIGSSDKIGYSVLTTNDLNFTTSEDEVKKYWENNKANFMTSKLYTLSVVWTKSEDTVVKEDEIKEHYDANSFNYTNAEGKQLTFEEAKVLATKDLKVKKSKKSAQKAYIAFKKGKLVESEKLVVALGDLKFTSEIWNEISKKSIGDILKPKVVGDTYATVKIVEIIEPKEKTYDEAKIISTKLYEDGAKKEALMAFASKKIETIDSDNLTVSSFIKLEKGTILSPLNESESMQFIQKLFATSQEKGMIGVDNKIVIFKILEQKFSSLDTNETSSIKETANEIKQNIFERNFIRILSDKYPTEVYMDGLINE